MGWQVEPCSSLPQSNGTPGTLLELWTCLEEEQEKEEEEREVDEEEEDPIHTDRLLDQYLWWPLPNREGIRTVVEELVNNLLCVC